VPEFSFSSFFSKEVEAMVQAISNNMQNILALLKDSGTLLLKPGEIFQAKVVAQQGDRFLLQVGDKLLPVRAETSILPGQKLNLEVLEWRGEELLVRLLQTKAGDAGDNQPKVSEQLQKIIERFGFRGEKDLQTIFEALQKLPVEEQTAVRYLLDPNLLAALLIPQQDDQGKQSFDRIEVNRYQGALANEEELWEVFFRLDLPHLGHLELKLKLADHRLFLQIWADSAATEQLLRSRKEDLMAFCALVDIVAVDEGPLVQADYTKNIDVKV
jgi:hypothetical protein